MLIVCPSCASEYAVDPAYLRPSGRKLRCAACREVFFVDAPADEEEDDTLDASWAEGMFEGDSPADAPGSRPAISVDAANSRSGRKAPRREGGVGARFGSLAAPFAALRAGATRVPLGLLLAVVLVGSLIGAFLGRESIVRSVPSTALLYDLAGMEVNLRGLEIENVVSGLSSEPSGTFLTVEGEIANRSGVERVVPPVTLSLWNEERQALYSWTIEPPRANLSPGESTRFRARLVAPPDEARQVLVRFAPDAPGTTVAEGGN